MQNTLSLIYDLKLLWGSYSFNMFLFFDLKHSTYWGLSDWNFKEIWCSTVRSVSELAWTPPAQTDTSAVRGMSVWRSADGDPEPKSAFHSSRGQSTGLTHIHYSSWCTGSCLARWPAYVARVRRITGRGLGAKKYIVCCNSPTQNKSSWTIIEIICDIEIDTKPPARCQQIYPTGMGFHREN